MLTAQKFQSFVNQLGLGTFNLNTDTLKLMLTNVAPVVTNTIKANLTEIAAGGGYTAGGEDTQNSWAASVGTATLTGTEITWVATVGGMAQFRYLALYDDTPAGDPLAIFWDNAVAVTLAEGESFIARFNNGSPTGTIATLQ